MIKEDEENMTWFRKLTIEMKWDENKMEYGIKTKYEIMKLASKHMIVINDNDYSNTYDKNNHNKIIKEWIIKIEKLLLTCVLICNNHNDNNSNNNNN